MKLLNVFGISSEAVFVICTRFLFISCFIFGYFWRNLHFRLIIKQCYCRKLHAKSQNKIMLIVWQLPNCDVVSQNVLQNKKCIVKAYKFFLYRMHCCWPPIHCCWFLLIVLFFCRKLDTLYSTFNQNAACNEPSRIHAIQNQNQTILSPVVWHW